MGFRIVVEVAVGSAWHNDQRMTFSLQLVRRDLKHPFGGGVEEGDSTVGIETANPICHRVQNQMLPVLERGDFPLRTQFFRDVG